MRTRAVAEGSFASSLSAYLADLHERSHSLRQRAEGVLPRLFHDLKGWRVRDVRGVREAHIVAFAHSLSQTTNARTGKGLSPTTQRLYLLAVRRFFAFLLKRGVILVDPAREIPFPRVKSLPRRVLTEAQARRLMSAPSRWNILGWRDRAILEMLYGAGVRRGECLRLNVTDVDLGQHQLFIQDGKGRKDRVVPLVGRADVALASYLKESRPELLRDSRQTALFLSSRGGRLSRSRLARLVQKHARDAGIQGSVFPHALRHSYATHLLKGRAGVREVQELLGHRNLETTMVYTRVGVEDLRGVLSRAHPRERAWRRKHPC